MGVLVQTLASVRLQHFLFCPCFYTAVVFFINLFPFPFFFHPFFLPSSPSALADISPVLLADMCTVLSREAETFMGR